MRHDYSTSRIGVVPAGERRSRYHFLSLWITLVAGFTYLFVGFQYHDAGYSLVKAVSAGAVGAVAYLVYALPAAYLGSVSGQTHALLTRSILGKVGSALVTVLLIGIAAGWTAFAFNLLATLYDPQGAVEVGWLDQVVPAGELEAAAIGEARRLGQLPAAAYAQSKKLLRQPLVDRVQAGGAADRSNFQIDAPT